MTASYLHLYEELAVGRLRNFNCNPLYRRSHFMATKTKSRTNQAKDRTSTSRKAGASRSGATKSGRSGSLATTDHDEIRRWAEERGGKPACVRGTGGRGDTGMIRIDFPTGPERSLQQISWDEWFEKFDEKNLALVLQQKTARGQLSRFNKLVSRDTVQQSRAPKTRTAGASMKHE
jgi:hypothetical protein